MFYGSSAQVTPYSNKQQVRPTAYGRGRIQQRWLCKLVKAALLSSRFACGNMGSWCCLLSGTRTACCCNWGPMCKMLCSAGNPLLALPSQSGSHSRDSRPSAGPRPEIPYLLRVRRERRARPQASVETLMHELEKWSIELQRHCPEDHARRSVRRASRSHG